MFLAVVYAGLQVLVDLLLVRSRKADRDQAELLVLRHHVRVLEWQVRSIRWRPWDRLVLAALFGHLPKPAWRSLLIRPETVLGWHQALVRRKWAAFG